MKFEYDNSSKNRFSFPAALTPDLDDDGYVVTFRDLPEAITQGDSIEVALQEAADCIEGRCIIMGWLGLIGRLGD